MTKFSAFLKQKFRLSSSQTIVGLAAAILGLILLIAPGTAASFVFNGIGGICIILGAINLVRYHMMDSRAAVVSNALAAGILWLVAGIAIIIFKGALISILPFFFGVAILVGGIGKLQGALNFKRMNVRRWYIELAFSAVSIAFGALILFNPFSTAMLLMRIIGIALLIEGISDLVSISAFEKKKSEYLEVEMRDAE